MPALIYLRCGGVDRGAMRIENTQNSRFIGRHAGWNSLEGILFHEKRGLHRAVVTPEPHGAQCRVVGATAIGKIKRHVPGTNRAGRSRPCERPSFRKRPFHEPASYELVLPPLPRGWVPAKRGDANGDAVGAALSLFLSAFGFFFSRLLLIWPLPHHSPDHPRFRRMVPTDSFSNCAYYALGLAGEPIEINGRNERLPAPIFGA
jgi:hypothetical protein